MAAEKSAHHQYGYQRRHDDPTLNESLRGDTRQHADSAPAEHTDEQQHGKAKPHPHVTPTQPHSGGTTAEDAAQTATA